MAGRRRIPRELTGTREGAGIAPVKIPSARRSALPYRFDRHTSPTWTCCVAFQENGNASVLESPDIMHIAGFTRSLRPGVEVHGAHHRALRSEEHTSELQSLMRISYAVFCLTKKKQNTIEELTNNTRLARQTDEPAHP